MFALEPNPDALRSVSSGGEAREKVEELIHDATVGLEFDPEQHVYTFYGRKIRNVSSIVEYFAPFDSRKAAEGVSRNPRHPLHGKTVEEILAIWEEKRDRASAAGTAVHAFGEACYEFLTGGKLPDEFADRLTPDGRLQALTPKEEAVARWWADLDWNRYLPVAKEVRLVHPELGYAGTPDLLLYEYERKGLRMKDYKTNEDLFKWFGGHLRAPLNAIRDDDTGKYTLQQTLYTIVLNDIGLNVLSNDLVWLKEDSSYQEVPLPVKYDRLVRYAVGTIN